MVTIGDGYRDGPAGAAGLSAAGRSTARLALESRHPARAHPPSAFQDYAPYAHVPRNPQVRGRRAMAVTVPQLGPVLNPHGPDLRE